MRAKAALLVPISIVVLLSVALWLVLDRVGRGPLSIGSVSAAPPRERRLLLLLDPTVFTADETDRLEEVTERLSALIGSLDEGTRLVVFHVVPRIQRDPIIDETIAFSRRPDWQVQLTKAREDLARHVRSSYERAWNDAHSETMVRQLRSCLIDSLTVIGRQGIAGCGAPDTCTLAIVSDLLEACGTTMNMERSELEHNEPLRELASLASRFSLKGVHCVLIDHTMAGEISSRFRLLDTWVTMFRQRGVQRVQDTLPLGETPFTTCKKVAESSTKLFPWIRGDAPEAP